MDLYFFDTSALVKRYCEEPGTDLVDKLIESEASTAISSLSIIETVSAFRRKYNQEEITEEEMYSILSEFFSEALNDFLIIPLEESASRFSFNLIIKEDLRTLDSLQLSAALSMCSEEDPVFVCSDNKLVSTAEEFNLKTVNPQRE